MEEQVMSGVKPVETKAHFLFHKPFQKQKMIYKSSVGSHFSVEFRTRGQQVRGQHVSKVGKMSMMSSDTRCGIA